MPSGGIKRYRAAAEIYRNRKKNFNDRFDGHRSGTMELLPRGCISQNGKKESSVLFLYYFATTLLCYVVRLLISFMSNKLYSHVLPSAHESSL